MRCALRSSSSTCADSADNGTARLYTLRCLPNVSMWAVRYHAASLGSFEYAYPFSLIDVAEDYQDAKRCQENNTNNNNPYQLQAPILRSVLILPPRLLLRHASNPSYPNDCLQLDYSPNLKRREHVALMSLLWNSGLRCERVVSIHRAAQKGYSRRSSLVLCSAMCIARSMGYTGLFTGGVRERACSPGFLEEFFSKTSSTEGSNLPHTYSVM